MESNYELSKTDNKNCPCHYFAEKTKIEDIVFGNILIDEKSKIRKYFGL